VYHLGNQTWTALPEFVPNIIPCGGMSNPTVWGIGIENGPSNTSMYALSVCGSTSSFAVFHLENGAVEYLAPPWTGVPIVWTNAVYLPNNNTIVTMGSYGTVFVYSIG
jgi:hypothetical protein